MPKKSPVRKILHKVISLEISKGHLRWKISDLARQVRVSRSLIYYHFGNTKMGILEKSLELVAEDFFGLTPERMQMLDDGRAGQTLLLSRELFLTEPAFALFYLKWRMTESTLQKRLIRIENRYQDMLKKRHPHLSPTDIQALHAIFYAVVTSPFLQKPAIGTLMKQAEQLILAQPEKR